MEEMKAKSLLSLPFKPCGKVSNEKAKRRGRNIQPSEIKRKWGGGEARNVDYAWRSLVGLHGRTKEQMEAGKQRIVACCERDAPKGLRQGNLTKYTVSYKGGKKRNSGLL